MNSKELASAVAEKARITKTDAALAVDAVFEAIGQALVAGEEVRVPGFGIFSVKDRAARTGINPATHEKIEIPASKAVAFKAAKNLKEIVAK